jgi:hypothetical protein
MGLAGRLARLEQRAALRGTSQGPYTEAWKRDRWGGLDEAGFSAYWAEFWAGLMPEQRAAIIAGYEAMGPGAGQ